MILIQVTKSGSESPTGLIRRFSKRVQESGVIRRAKSLRYNQRTLSVYKRKMAALKRLANRERIEKLKKLGKLKDAPRKRF
jgi:putative ubiquitin-RnfH superfamily antitoxin RatB of RatAB toxin-antitoxin module